MKRKQQATASGEDYLEAILVIQMHKGAVRSVDIARHMEVELSIFVQCLNPQNYAASANGCSRCLL